jgi:hypothetical protein
MKSLSSVFAVGIAVAALIASSGAGLAHGGTDEEQAACTPDVLSLCLFEIPNEDRIVACLNRKRDQLSPACRAVIDPSPKSKAHAKH